MADFRFSCPKCSQNIECDASYAGSQITCPSCKQSIAVPAASQTSVAPAEWVIRIKHSTLRNCLIGFGALLAAGIIAIVIYSMTNSMRSIWKNWSVMSGDENHWSFAGGKIHAHSTAGDAILASDKEYGDATFSATVSTTNREASLAVRMQDANNGYLVIYTPHDTRVIKRTDGNEITLASHQIRKLSSKEQPARIMVITKATSIEVRLNGTSVLRVKDASYASGYFGLRIFGSPDWPCDATFSRVKLQ